MFTSTRTGNNARVYNDPADDFFNPAWNMAMRILIDDDEYLARSGLRSMLEELNLPLEIICEAANGEEMALLVSRYLPDIAFVDIRMPKLNGLEAIRMSRMASPHTQWFILSGFPEFDYAQEAIRLGVAGYLLKPVNPDELRKVLSDFIEEDRKRIAAQNKQFERELIALSYGLTSLELEEADPILSKSHFSGAMIYLDSYLEEKIKAERQFKFCHTVQKLIDPRLDHHNRITLYVLPGGELTTVGAWEPLQNTRAEQLVRGYFQVIEQEARDSSSKDLAITILISKECPTYQELQDQMERLQKLAPLRAAGGIGTVTDLTALNKLAEKPGWLAFTTLVLNLCRCYQERSYSNYAKALQHLEKFMAGTPAFDHSLLTQLVADFVQRSMNCPLESGQSLKSWIPVLRQHGEHLLNEMPKDEIQGLDLIDQVIAYIDQHYMFNTGIGQIAERFYITPNYLSTLFHKKTGVNFMSYLKKIRLLKAKELLADPKIQVQQVAEQVGYFSARHFARLFAEQFGCLPSEYRDRFKNR